MGAAVMAEAAHDRPLRHAGVRRARRQRGDPASGPRREAAHEPGRRRAASPPRAKDDGEEARPRRVRRHAAARPPPAPRGQLRRLRAGRGRGGPRAGPDRRRRRLGLDDSQEAKNEHNNRGLTPFPLWRLGLALSKSKAREIKNTAALQHHERIGGARGVIRHQGGTTTAPPATTNKAACSASRSRRRHGGAANLRSGAPPFVTEKVQ